jgi:serine/threonine protein kinase
VFFDGGTSLHNLIYTTSQTTCISTNIVFVDQRIHSKQLAEKNSATRVILTRFWKLLKIARVALIRSIFYQLLQGYSLMIEFVIVMMMMMMMMMIALSALHARSIVHRDVKPDNILIAKIDDDSVCRDDRRSC